MCSRVIGTVNTFVFEFINFKWIVFIKPLYEYPNHAYSYNDIIVITCTEVLKQTEFNLNMRIYCTAMLLILHNKFNFKCVFKATVQNIF